MDRERPLHVAQFVHRYPPALGGAEAYCERLCGYLVGCGDRVTVFTTTALELNDFQFRSEVMIPTDEDSGSQRIRRFRPMTFPLRRYILKSLSLIPHRPWQAATQPSGPVCPDLATAAASFDEPLDAVHAMAFPYTFPIVCAYRLARRRGVPFFLTPFLHLGDPLDPRDRTRRQYTRPHLRWLLRRADGVFVQTPSEHRAVVKLGLPENRVHLQGLGVDAAECTGGDREKARAAWGFAPEEVAIGHLANASIEKGTVDLLTAVARENLRVVLAGPAMPNFERFWQTFPRKDLVTRLGPLGDSQKRDFYAGIDAFALPSRTDSFGLVLLEAWAAAKPVIAYRAGGPADLVRQGADGWLVPCGDVAALALALSECGRDGGRRASFGANGRARIAAEFAWEPKLAMVRLVMWGVALPLPNPRPLPVE